MRRRIEIQAALLEPAVEPALPQEERPALEQALLEIPTEQREVMYLKVYEHMTFQQIGERLSIPSNTAASRSRYGIERPRQILDPPCRAGTDNHDDAR